jgi:hypothetical protein
VRNTWLDWILPGPGAVAAHKFVDPSDDSFFTGAVASVLYQNPGGGMHLTFPFAHDLVYPVIGRTAGQSATAQLFGEILALFGEGATIPTGGTPPSRGGIALSVSPNPFNPATTVSFTNVGGLTGSIRIYDLRGQLVRVLHDGEFTAETFRWDGKDGGGSFVASGVYLVQATAGEVAQTRKIALVR